MADVADAADAHPLVRLAARAVHGLLDLARGYPARAERCLAEVADQSVHGPLTDWSASLSVVGLARLRLADDSPGEAVQVAERVVETLAHKGLWLLATDVVPAYVDALVRAGRPEQAGSLVEEFGTWSEGRTAPAPAAALLTCRAILAPAEAAAPLFAEAARAWAALPRPYDELLAVERQGACMLGGADHESGVAVLREAYRRLRELGARWDADRVARTLRENGAEVGYASRRGRQGYGLRLSPRELEVTALVAEGLTNRQIAERLFLAHRTVDRHLSGAMRKLGVSSRTTLALAAAEAGLLSPTADQIG
jgi:DNA-binding CsgD family transcriptional regulator